jgi:hypothetical protein
MWESRAPVAFEYWFIHPNVEGMMLDKWLQFLVTEGFKDRVELIRDEMMTFLISPDNDYNTDECLLFSPHSSSKIIKLDNGTSEAVWPGASKEDYDNALDYDLLLFAAFIVQEDELWAKYNEFMDEPIPLI